MTDSTHALADEMIEFFRLELGITTDGDGKLSDDTAVIFIEGMDPSFQIMVEAQCAHPIAERIVRLWNNAATASPSPQETRRALEAVRDWDEHDANPASYGGLPAKIRKIVDDALRENATNERNSHER